MTFCFICGGIPLTWFNPTLFLWLFQARTFQHHMLWSPIYIHWFVVTFCRCWWNCWPSLFKLSFHKLRKQKPSVSYKQTSTQRLYQVHLPMSQCQTQSLQRQFGGFLRVLRLPPPIKLKYCWKWRQTT